MKVRVEKSSARIGILAAVALSTFFGLSLLLFLNNQAVISNAFIIFIAFGVFLALNRQYFSDAILAILFVVLPSIFFYFVAISHNPSTLTLHKFSAFVALAAVFSWIILYRRNRGKLMVSLAALIPLYVADLSFDPQLTLNSTSIGFYFMLAVIIAAFLVLFMEINTRAGKILKASVSWILSNERASALAVVAIISLTFIPLIPSQNAPGLGPQDKLTFLSANTQQNFNVSFYPYFVQPFCTPYLDMQVDLKATSSVNSGFYVISGVNNYISAVTAYQTQDVFQYFSSRFLNYSEESAQNRKSASFSAGTDGCIYFITLSKQPGTVSIVANIRYHKIVSERVNPPSFVQLSGLAITTAVGTVTTGYATILSNLISTI